MNDHRELVGALLENARYSLEDLARQTELSEEAVESALEDLESAGTIQGYQAVVDWDELEEEHVEANVELNVELDRETGYDQIARRITKYPEVASLRLISGDYDFAVTVEGDSLHDVSQFVSEQIAPIPEVTQTVSHFVMETYKDRGIEFHSDGDDDRLSVSP